MAQHSYTSLPRSKGNSLRASEQEVADETTPLFSSATRDSYDSTVAHRPRDEEDGRSESDPDVKEEKSTMGLLSVLLIGVFISQADTSLMLATYGIIASEFDSLDNSSWLLSSYMLAVCVGQPLYGKLSDIFGRKKMLQAAHLLFATGSALCGICQTMPQLVAARALQGLGGAGIMIIVSILITDLVPIRSVATWRSYVNVVQTIGRSSGGALGGFLAQSLGWRWTLSGQAPLTLIAMMLVAWKLEEPKKAGSEADDAKTTTLWTQLKRVDFLGALFLSATTVCFLLILDMGGKKAAWNSSLILGLALVGTKSLISFIVVESRVAKEPIFPLRLLKSYPVVSTYFMLSLMNACQTALMFFVPLYFEVTANSSPSEAGVYMLPSIAGNAFGGLVIGTAIKRSGRYKMAIVGATVMAVSCFSLLYVSWTGSTSGWQALLTIPGGLGSGMAHSAIFVALAREVAPSEIPVAFSGLYLCSSVGTVAGLCGASAMFMSVTKSELRRVLVHEGGIANGEKIARQALKDVTFVQRLTGHVRELVVGAYVSGFHSSLVMSAMMAAVAFLFAVTTREKRLA